MRALLTLPAAIALGLAGFAALSARADETALPAIASKEASAPVNPRAWSLRQTPVVEVVRKVKDAVVNIHSERTVRAGGTADELFTLSPAQNRVNGMGTGILIDGRGYIVTNQHVVDDVTALRVRLSDGTNHVAKIIARDVESDLALIKINPGRTLPVMPLGTARDLQVGETVVAVGNAYGYDHTVTLGIVSAIGRDVTLNKEVRYKSLIQTDAAINPGNSGGPLVNLNGELVGVNVAIRAGAQGIGFAIPVDNMITVGSRMLAQVRAKASVGSVGIVLRDEAPAGTSRKVVVDAIDPGPASKAGLRKGDEIVKVGDLPAHSSLDLERALLELDAGAKVDLVVRRDGSQQRLSLTLDAAREARTAPAVLTSGMTAAASQVWRQVGVRVSAVTNSQDIARAFPQLQGGLSVGDVRSESPAARAGLKSGDILVGLHQWEMTSTENVLYVLNHPERATFSPLTFYIIRAGQVHKGRLHLAD